MPHDASGDVRLPHVNDLHSDVATFMIARAFAETYRDVLTSGDLGAGLADLPECVTFMPQPWRGLDVLMQAEKAVHDPQPLVT